MLLPLAALDRLVAEHLIPTHRLADGVPVVVDGVGVFALAGWKLVMRTPEAGLIEIPEDEQLSFASTLWASLSSPAKEAILSCDYHDDGPHAAEVLAILEGLTS